MAHLLCCLLTKTVSFSLVLLASLLLALPQLTLASVSSHRDGRTGQLPNLCVASADFPVQLCSQVRSQRMTSQSVCCTCSVNCFMNHCQSPLSLCLATLFESSCFSASAGHEFRDKTNCGVCRICVPRPAGLAEQNEKVTLLCCLVTSQGLGDKGKPKMTQYPLKVSSLCLLPQMPVLLVTCRWGAGE